MGEIRLFAINYADTWAGYDLESCIVAAMSETGLSMIELVDDYARELTNEEMDSLFFVDDDGERRTFREQLELFFRQSDSVPFFFASSEA